MFISLMSNQITENTGGGGVHVSGGTFETSFSSITWNTADLGSVMTVAKGGRVLVLNSITYIIIFIKN